MGIHEILSLLGGVALLIFGIKVMGDALQELAGDNLRKLLASLTGTPIKGAAVGAIVTMIIQSSSATTVMVVSFVQAGLMNLAQGFSVIMGANIGTTITAQLIAFNIKEYSIIAAIIGAALTVMGRNTRQKQAGLGLMGFALLFVGMSMMQGAMSFLSGRQDLFMVVNDDPLKGLFVGAAVTMLVQASAATVGLTMAMASQGLLSLPAAVAIILGDNIGTTITAVLASLGGSRAAKQAAAAHVLFNVIGASLMMLLLGPFVKLVMLTSNDVARQVANSHSVFNIINSLIFLPFTVPYTRFIKRLLPDAEPIESTGEPNAKYLDDHLIEVSPAVGIDAVRKEIANLGLIALKMLKDCRAVVVDRDTELMNVVLSSEKNINRLYHGVMNYSAKLGQKILAPDLSMLLNSLVGGASDIERIGDHCENFIELVQYMAEREQHFSHKAEVESAEMFDLVISAVEKSVRAIETENYALVSEVMDIESKVDQMENVLRARHIERLNSGKCSPSAAVVFIDILSNLERVGDHAHNLSMVVKDIKTIHSKRVKEG